MPKDGLEGGKSQLFRLNYVYGVFQLQNSQRLILEVKRTIFTRHFSIKKKFYNITSSILIL